MKIIDVSANVTNVYNDGAVVEILVEYKYRLEIDGLVLNYKSKESDVDVVIKQVKDILRKAIDE